MDMQQHGGGIGGYFGLEVTPHHNFPQSSGLLLNAGRHALAYLLQHMPVPPTKVYIPFYTCASVRRAVERLGIPYEQYHLDARMLPADAPELKPGEYLVQTNYFGLMDAAWQTAADYYGNALIADMAQALYAPATAMSFYSPAKWCGISDGGVGTGPHILPGIEVYGSGVIFHGLGNFVFRNDEFDYLPEEFYTRRKTSRAQVTGVGAIGDIMTQGRTRGLPVNTAAWESVVASLQCTENEMRITLHPVNILFRGAPKGLKGLPVLADDTSVLRRLQQLSQPWGTELCIDEEARTAHLAVCRR